MATATLDRDMILGPNGPLPAAGAKQMNGKPRDAEPKSAARHATALEMIPVDRIRPNPFQPRLEFDGQKLEHLAASLRKDGFLQPLLVRPGSAYYQIIAGERRFQAAKLAKFVEVPCLTREATDAEMAELAIVENDQREELNPIERAKGYQRIMAQQKITQVQLGERLKRSQAFVANAVRLLDLPADWQDRVISRQMSQSHAMEFLPIAGFAIARTSIEKLLAEREPDLGFPSLSEWKGMIAKVHADCFGVDRPAKNKPAAPKLPAMTMTLEEFRTDWINELLDREIERRGMSAMLKLLGIKLLDAWRRDLAGRSTDAFFAIHSKEQLVELAAELGVHVDCGKPKDTIIKQLKASPATRHKLPAVLAGEKPAKGKKKGGK